MNTSPEPRDAAAAKAGVRAHARAARCALQPETCVGLALDAAERLLALPELAIARTVLAYGANAEEIDPSPAVGRLRACGAVIAYPRVDEPGVLELHVIEDEAELVAGAYGILEPPHDAPALDAAEIDAVIVPGVAFDEGCWRLGYGGGFYDRLLPRLRGDCALIGLAYDEQVLDEIPAETHDVRLHAVVTPTRVLRANAPRAG